MIRNNLIAAVLAAFSFLLALPALAETAEGLSSAAGGSVTVSEMQKEGGTTQLMTTGNGGGIPAFSVTVNPDGSEDYSVTLQILALMTALGFLPAIVILMTSFTRIVVVMSILRQAMGLQQTPSNQVIIGIAMFLTFFIMSPVLDKINTTALQPYINEQITAPEALSAAQIPIRQFMLKQTRG